MNVQNHFYPSIHPKVFCFIMSENRKRKLDQLKSDLAAEHEGLMSRIAEQEIIFRECVDILMDILDLDREENYKRFKRAMKNCVGGRQADQSLQIRYTRGNNVAFSEFTKNQMWSGCFREQKSRVCNAIQEYLYEKWKDFGVTKVSVSSCMQGFEVNVLWRFETDIWRDK